MKAHSQDHLDENHGALATPYIRMEVRDDKSLRIAARGIAFLGTLLIASYISFRFNWAEVRGLVEPSQLLSTKIAWDSAGYIASALVVAAFSMKDILSLRSMAILSNLAFLIYGLGLNLGPVWLLHAILLPLNSFRLWQALRIRASSVANATTSGAY
jgi:hypothetical protein